MRHVPEKTEGERFIVSRIYREKKYFFYTVKKFPQIIEKTREIIRNMSEIF